MFKKLLAVTFFATVLFSSNLLAESLLDVWADAQKADPVFLGAGYERDAMYEIADQTSARRYPSLVFAAEHKRTEQDIRRASNTVYAAGSKMDFDTDAWSATLTQPLFNHESNMRVKQSTIAKDRSDIEFEKAYQDLMLRVAESYFEKLKAEEQLAAIAAEKQALQRHYEYAQKSYEAGITRQAEATDAEARYLSSLAQEIEYQRVNDDAKYRLREIIGRLPKTLSPMKEELSLSLPEPTDPEAWIAQGLENNPDVLIPRKNVEEARYEVKVQDAGHYPRVDFYATHGNEDTGGSLFGGGSDVDTTEIGVKLELAIFQGGAVNSRQREAKKRMLMSAEQEALAARTLENQAQSAYRGIVANIAQIKALRKTVAAQQSVVENKEKGLQSGLYSMIAVLDAQQDLASARQSYVEARNDYAINFVRLKRAAGVLSESDLAKVNGWLEYK